MSFLEKGLLFLCLIAFAVQLYSSLQQLFSLNLITVSNTMKSNELEELPLITICSNNQYQPDHLKDVQYTDFINLLAGLPDLIIDGQVDESTVSWGDHAGLNFTQLRNKVLDAAQIRDIQIIQEGESTVSKEKYLPKYGICRQVTKYNISKDLVVNIPNITNDVKVFVTDPRQSTFYRLDRSSQQGDQIHVGTGKACLYAFRVKVHTIISDQQFVECNHHELTGYQNCVNDKAKDFVLREMSCLPPWLSEDLVCNQTIQSKNVRQFLTETLKPKLIKPLDYYKTPELENDCSMPCKNTKLYVSLKGSDPIPGNISVVSLEFDPEVLVLKQQKSYTFQNNFMTDLGSNLGLWLGLSMLGLMDVVVSAFFKIKKFGNVK